MRGGLAGRPRPRAGIRDVTVDAAGGRPVAHGPAAGGVHPSQLDRRSRPSPLASAQLRVAALAAALAAAAGYASTSEQRALKASGAFRSVASADETAATGQGFMTEIVGEGSVDNTQYAVGTFEAQVPKTLLGWGTAYVTLVRSFTKPRDAPELRLFDTTKPGAKPTRTIALSKVAVQETCNKVHLSTPAADTCLTFTFGALRWRGWAGGWDLRWGRGAPEATAIVARVQARTRAL
jgi:hypothetical protein